MRQPRTPSSSAFCSLFYHLRLIPRSSPPTRCRPLLSQGRLPPPDYGGLSAILSIDFHYLRFIQISVTSALAQSTETVGWQSDPNGRGTFTLVSSCIFTLTICVYSAMHLNVPPHEESAIQFWLRNIRWGLLGIFGPELVVFIAWKQDLSAKSIVRRAQSGPRGNSDRRDHERLNVKKDTDLVT